MRRTSVILVVVGTSLSMVASAAQQAVFPPPPPKQSPVEGAIDFHVHSGPDTFGRNLDDVEVARLAVRAGIRALVFKNHTTSTADRAQLVSKHVPGIEAFGGIVLSRAVGGINPYAVEWMFRMEGGRGKVVWLPTFDAAYHKQTFKAMEEGIKVASGGKVTPEMEAVLKIVSRENLVLQTGHVSPDEVLTVLRRAKQLGVKNMVVTHAMSVVPGLSIEQMKEVGAMGGFLELIFLTHLMGPQAHVGWMRNWPRVSIDEMAQAIKAVGAQHFVLGTDLGQSGNPVHPDGYKLFVTGLKSAGISEREMDRMTKTNPAKLLGLD